MMFDVRYLQCPYTDGASTGLTRLMGLTGLGLRGLGLTGFRLTVLTVLTGFTTYEDGSWIALREQ